MTTTPALPSHDGGMKSASLVTPPQRGARAAAPPVRQPLADLLLEAAAGRLVDLLAAERVRPIVLAGEGVGLVVVVSDSRRRRPSRRIILVEPLRIVFGGISEPFSCARRRAFL